MTSRVGHWGHPPTVWLSSSLPKARSGVAIIDRWQGVGRAFDRTVSSLCHRIATLLVCMLVRCHPAPQAVGRNGWDDKVPYNHLLNECVLAGDWDKGTEVLRRMVNEGKGGKGTRFDSNTFRALSQVHGLFFFFSLGFCLLRCSFVPFLFCSVTPLFRYSVVP